MVTKSWILSLNPQPDGRQRVTEAHQSEDGTIMQLSYLAEADTNVDEVLAERQEILNIPVVSTDIMGITEVELGILQESKIILARVKEYNLVDKEAALIALPVLAELGVK